MKLNAAQQLIEIWTDRPFIWPVDYKAPHANRPTPPRPHFDRAESKAKARARYLDGFKEPQPLQFKNRGERRRILEAEFDMIAMPPRPVTRQQRRAKLDALEAGE